MEDVTFLSQPLKRTSIDCNFIAKVTFDGGPKVHFSKHKGSGIQHNWKLSAVTDLEYLLAPISSRSLLSKKEKKKRLNVNAG